jgi:hypothetical protein
MASATNTVRAAATKMPRVHSALHFPLRKAISKRLWKLWGAGLAGLLVAAAILAAGYFDSVRAGELGPGFHSLFDLASSRAIRVISSVQVLLAGQLALFIWWARSRGQNGAPYRYRTWAWLAAVCFVASFAIGVDAHLALADTIAWAAGDQVTVEPQLGWLVPTGCCLLAFLCLLHADLKQCKTSLVLFWLAVMSWAGAAAIDRGVEL